MSKKNQIAQTNVTSAIKTGNTNNVNLEKFKQFLENKNFDSVQSIERESIYKYPDYITPDLRSEKAGKTFRKQTRDRLKKHVNNIELFFKKNRIDDLNTEVAEFKAFYAERFLKNDYSINSITNLNPEKSFYKELVLFLNFVKEYES